MSSGVENKVDEVLLVDSVVTVSASAEAEALFSTKMAEMKDCLDTLPELYKQYAAVFICKLLPFCRQRHNVT